MKPIQLTAALCAGTYRESTNGTWITNGHWLVRKHLVRKTKATPAAGALVDYAGWLAAFGSPSPFPVTDFVLSDLEQFTFHGSTPITHQDQIVSWVQPLYEVFFELGKVWVKDALDPILVGPEPDPEQALAWVMPTRITATLREKNLMRKWFENQ